VVNGTTQVLRTRTYAYSRNSDNPNLSLVCPSIDYQFSANDYMQLFVIRSSTQTGVCNTKPNESFIKLELVRYA